MSNKLRLYQPKEEDRKVELAGVPIASLTRRASGRFLDFWFAGILFLIAVVGAGMAQRYSGYPRSSPDLL